MAEVGRQVPVVGWQDAEVPIVEPIPVTDTFCTDIARIERVGDNVRCWLVADQTAPDGSKERLVVGKLVGERAWLHRALVVIAAALKDGAMQ